VNITNCLRMANINSLYTNKNLLFNRLSPYRSLLILTLAGSLGLFLALYAGFFVVFSLAELCEYAASCTLSLESAKCAVEIFTVFKFNFCHFFPSLRIGKEIIVFLCYNVLYNNKIDLSRAF